MLADVSLSFVFAQKYEPLLAKTELWWPEMTYTLWRTFYLSSLSPLEFGHRLLSTLLKLLLRRCGVSIW